MNFQETLSGPLGQRLAWTLLHFLWQGVAISAGVAAAGWLLSPAQTRGRYAVALAGLVLMACCPLVTFGVLPVAAPNPAALAPASDLSVAGRKPPGRVEIPGSDRAMPTAPALGDALVSKPPASPVPEPPAERDWRGLLARRAAAIQPYAIAAWLAGVVVLSGRLLMSLLGVRRLARGRLPVSAELAACAARLARRLRLCRLPGVFLSPRIREAMLVELWRPMVLLPAAWIAEMPPDVLEAVIAHELAHVRRLDLWANLLQRLVETLLFYHPAVWWLSRRTSLLREMCADELAVEATGDRVTYAGVLEHLGRRRLNLPTPQLAAGIGGRRMALFDRVRNVLGVSPADQRRRWWPAGIMALLVPLGLWLVSVGMAQSQLRPTQDTAAETKPAADKARVEGVVMFGGKARSGIDVELSQPGPDPDNPQRITTTTDAGGRFEFPVVRPGKTSLVPRIRLSSGKEFVSLGLMTTIELKPGQTRDLVFGGLGRPVVGQLRMPANWEGPGFNSIRGRYFLEAPAFHLINGEWPRGLEYGEFLKSDLGKGYSEQDIRVAADGRFRLPRVPFGEFFVEFDMRREAGGTEFCAGKKFVVDPMPGGTSDEPLDLGTLDLRVLVDEPEGETDKKAESRSPSLVVGLDSAAKPASERAPAKAEPPGNSGGTPQKAGDPAGKTPAANSASSPKNAAFQPQSEQVVGQRLKGDCSLSGQVLDADTGKPVTRAKVYLFYVPTFVPMFVYTASDGTFLLKDLPKGPFTLRTSFTPGYQNADYNPDGVRGIFPQFSLKDHEQRAGIVFKLKPAGSISGKIRDENGKVPEDIASFTVLAWSKGDDGKYKSEHATVDRKDGSYKIDGLSDKPVYVMAINFRAAKEGNARPPIYYPGVFSRSEAKPITFDGTRRAENIDITLRKAGGLVLEGTVRDQAGKPVPEAFVVVHHRDMLFDYATAYTDQQGHYQIQGLGEGAYLVHVDAVHRGFVRKRSPIDLEKGSKEARLDFALDRGAAISGKLVNEKGRQWQVRESYGNASVNVGKPKPGSFSSTGFRNKFRPQDSGGFSSGTFELGEGDYDDGDMIFPTKSTFVIQGMMPGRATIEMLPKEEGQQVLKILHAGRDIKESGLDTKAGEEIKDLTIVIGRKSAEPSATKPKPAATKASDSSAKASAAAPADNASTEKEIASGKKTTAERPLSPGSLPLTTTRYYRLTRLDVRRHYGIDDDQEKNLREISAAFEAVQADINKAFKEAQELPPQQRKAKQDELFNMQSQQIGKPTRKRIEEVLTRNQRAEYERDVLCELAIELCRDPEEKGNALKLDLSQPQKQQLKQLAHDLSKATQQRERQEDERLLAMLTTEQRERLFAKYPEAEIAGPYVTFLQSQLAVNLSKKPPLPLDFNFRSRGGAIVGVYGALWDESVRKQMGVSAEETAELNAIWTKSETAAQQIFDSYEPKETTRKLPADEKASQAEYRQELEALGKGIIWQIDAALSQAQRQTLMNRLKGARAAVALRTAVRDSNDAVFDELHATAEQRAKVREICRELELLYLLPDRATGKKARRHSNAPAAQKAGRKPRPRGLVIAPIVPAPYIVAQLRGRERSWCMTNPECARGRWALGVCAFGAAGRHSLCSPSEATLIATIELKMPSWCARDA